MIIITAHNGNNIKELINIIETYHHHRKKHKTIDKQITN